ncbi:MAG: histidine kinase dimerization/phospho-acceptor domain-containing protein, partial [Planctomycetota bacterium]
MPRANENPIKLPLRWRVAGLSLVTLALVLAGAGTVLALQQIRSLTDRTLDQAVLWAQEAHRAPDLENKTALQPDKAFVEEQRRTVVVLMLVYGGLTAAALATLLIAMWLLLRLVRREMALSELKANFVADVSHELKTPLALIRLFAETLQAGRVPSDEKRNEYYSVILRESNRLTNLINNILDFSRIDAGRKEY